MFSNFTTRSGSATFGALSLADDEDASVKAVHGGSFGAPRPKLVPEPERISALPTPAASPLTLCVAAGRKATGSATAIRISVLVIGSSTGGPGALAQLIPNLPADLPVPILVVQHMPARFTHLLAARLQEDSAVRVDEAVDGMRALPGHVIIAAGDHHLKLHRQGGSVLVDLDQGPAVNFCRPSVDVLFRSAAAVYRGEVLSVILTGMGSDGLHGTEALKAEGAYSLVQDEASSAVWGMPGAVARAGLADQILPIEKMAAEIVRLVAGNIGD